ncbi:MAG: hypothetical protein PUD81_07675 [Eggerthellales bacterium]|nr:hypothetical protein [Eggerthellales bacterium]
MFRPLPGAADASVEYTVTIKDRFTDDVIATKTFQMTVKAFAQDDLDAAAAFMTATATADVYWDGLACEGADKFNINQSASLQRNCYGRMMMSRRI